MDKNRAAFEKWASNKGFSVYSVPNANGEPCYVNNMTAFAWEAWQASQPQVSEDEKGLLDSGAVMMPHGWRHNIESAIRSLRYAAHPHRSPHADDLEAMLKQIGN